MPHPYHPTKSDGRVVRDQNVLSVLSALHSFGHLRRQEIAKLVWHKSSERSSYLMACRTVSKMLDSGQLLEKPNSLGGASFVLAAKGVQTLKEQGVFDAQEGYELSPDGPQFFHRMMGANYLIQKQIGGADVYSEYSLIRGKSPVEVRSLKERFNKAPDGVILYDGRLHAMREGYMMLDWVEVESAYKPYKEVRKALNLLLEQDFSLQSLVPGKEIVLNKLVFVYDRRQKHERWLLASLKRFLKDVQSEYGGKYSSDALLGEVMFAPCHVDYPLSFRGCEEVPAAEMLRRVKLSSYDEANID